MFFIHVWSDVTCVSAYGQLQTEGRLHLSLNFWTVTKGLRRKGAPWTWTPFWECNRQGVTPAVNLPPLLLVAVQAAGDP